MDLPVALNISITNDALIASVLGHMILCVASFGLRLLARRVTTEKLEESVCRVVRNNLYPVKEKLANLSNNLTDLKEHQTDFRKWMETDDEPMDVIPVKDEESKYKECKEESEPPRSDIFGRLDKFTGPYPGPVYPLPIDEFLQKDSEHVKLMVAYSRLKKAKLDHNFSASALNQQILMREEAVFTNLAHSYLPHLSVTQIEKHINELYA